MNMTGRDRKILLAAVPVALIVAYWFLLLGPKRQEASTATQNLQSQEQRRDQAKTQVASVENSKKTFASDYTSLVKLGKAVPTRLDMPGVIVQLQAAAKGTGITFDKIATGTREAPAAPAAPAAGGSSGSSGGSPSPGGSSTTPQPPAAPGQGNGSQPAAAGGAKAQSAPGGQAENAGNAVNNANSSSDKAGGSATDTTTSTPAGGTPAAAGASSGAAGLDSVPLDLQFSGSFFKLADFFHSLKRFVRVANQRISVRGRLMTVESLKFSSDPDAFPKLKAELQATVYLAPVSQGATAGASPQGPAPAPQAGTPTSTPSTPTTPPAATAAPPAR